MTWWNPEHTRAWSWSLSSCWSQKFINCSETFQDPALGLPAFLSCEFGYNFTKFCFYFYYCSPAFNFASVFCLLLVLRRLTAFPRLGLSPWAPEIVLPQLPEQLSCRCTSPMLPWCSASSSSSSLLLLWLLLSWRERNWGFKSGGYLATPRSLEPGSR